MQWLKWFIFWNISSDCKIIISFLELFWATCFLCILQTQLIRRNTSIPRKLQRRQHITFMMASSNDDKSSICRFFYEDFFHIVNICRKIMFSPPQLFWATCFLCILQTQLIRRNTSIPRKLQRRQHITFMMASSNDDKSSICRFFYEDFFHIVNICRKIMFSPPQPWDSQKSPVQVLLRTLFFLFFFNWWWLCI